MTQEVKEGKKEVSPQSTLSAQPPLMNNGTNTNLQQQTTANIVAQSSTTVNFATPTSLYQELLQIVGNDVLEIFGPTGSGKTAFAYEVVNSAVALKKKVYYFDTERNFKEPPKEVIYAYKPKWDDVYAEIKKLDGITELPGLIVLDSLGAPILGEFASNDAKERGQALLEAAAVAYRFKYLSDSKKCLVIILNQPESEFAKGKDYELQPFGDKHAFFAKEIWRSRVLSTSPNETVANIDAFRSRQFGRGRLLYTIAISGTPNQQKRIVTKKWSATGA
jgi:hypothetical protein